MNCDNKDYSINSLLKSLDLDKRGWIIVDYWEDDRCAIGISAIKEPRHLVYICTFGKDENRYDYECETPVGPKLTDYKTVDAGENVGYAELLKVMEKHLIR
jgi:hypothetical protein